MKTWNGEVLKTLELPTFNGKETFHGAIIDFDVRPPKLHSNASLLFWLEARGMKSN